MPQLESPRAAAQEARAPFTRTEPIHSRSCAPQLEKTHMPAHHNEYPTKPKKKKNHEEREHKHNPTQFRIRKEIKPKIQMKF